MRKFFTQRPGLRSFMFLGSTIVVLLILIPLTSIFVASNVASHPLPRPKQKTSTQLTSHTGTAEANTTSKTNPASTASITPSPVPTSIVTPVTPRPTPTKYRPPAIQPTPTAPASQPQAGVSSPQFSFEDGLTVSWQGAGPIIIQNSTDRAEDGGHALKASFTALAASNYPYISVTGSNIPDPSPQAGQTLKAYIYIPSGSPTTSAWWFVADSNNAWHKSVQQFLTQGMWNQVTFTMPNINSRPTRMGLQFATGSGGTAYIDAISWS